MVHDLFLVLAGVVMGVVGTVAVVAAWFDHRVKFYRAKAARQASEPRTVDDLIPPAPSTKGPDAMHTTTAKKLSIAPAPALPAPQAAAEYADKVTSLIREHTNVRCVCVTVARESQDDALVTAYGVATSDDARNGELLGLVVVPYVDNDEPWMVLYAHNIAICTEASGDMHRILPTLTSLGYAIINSAPDPDRTVSILRPVSVN